MKSKNKNLNDAKKNKNDEFYTLLPDIEKELQHYKEQFENKIVYCNCDDPTISNFWKYFYDNFKDLKLKKLIATHYNRTDNPVYKWEYNGKQIIKTQLQQNDGDFRNPECVEILKSCDIVCTNPPFSLFREYVAQLIKYNKKFLVIGNFQAFKYKNIFPYILKNIIKIGYNNGGMSFNTPNGQISLFIVWFTNLKVNKINKKLILKETYNPNKYTKYDNYDAINVDKLKNISKDYNGMMGVPITYILKHNPEQFKILQHFRCPSINNKNLFSRLIIQKIQKD